MVMQMHCLWKYSATFPVFDYRYKAPAVFAQIARDLGMDVSVTGSLRWDDHSEYRDQVSPRLSLLYRPGPWTIRASWGRGFYAPTPLIANAGVRIRFGD